MTAKCLVLSDDFDGWYFESTVNVNYFSEGGDAPGTWFGQGAEALQLRGAVDATELKRVLAGYHPRHNQSLVQFKRRKDLTTGQAETALAQPAVAHRPGFDLQFSVPKSLSAVWAVAPPALREQIEAALDRAVKATLAYAEEHLFLTRRGLDGHLRERAKLVVAMYDHITSRAGEPQLHRHCVANNVCQRADGSFGTLDSRALHNWARTLGPLFRSTLAVEVRGIGFNLVDATKEDGTRRGYFEVAGVSQALIDEWSTRQQQMKDFLEGTGDSLGNASAHAREHAAIQTRDAKPLHRPRQELHDEWRTVAAQHGFTPELAEALTQGRPEVAHDPTAYDRAWTQALANLTQSEAHFTERRLIQEVAEQLQTGQMTGAEIALRVSADLDQERDIVPLQPEGSDRCFTTKEMWQLEQELLTEVQLLNDRPGAQVPERIINQILRSNSYFNDEQQQAVRTMLSGESAICALTGVAGAGKSTTLKKVKEGLELAGYDVVGLAQSGIAKEGLAAATGMPSQTIASFLRPSELTKGERAKEQLVHATKQVERFLQGKTLYAKAELKLNEHSVVVIDEAGMNHTRLALGVLRQVREAGAKVMLSGDYRQLQPIEAGGPFRSITQLVSTSHLSVNIRQQDPQDREAVAALRDGRSADALRNYAERGRITVGENRRDAIHKLVDQWAANGGTRRPTQHVIFTQTRAEAAEANRLCQETRLEAAWTPHLISVRHGEQRFYRGDRILFHKTARRHGVENGFRGTVIGVDPIRRELRVKLDQQLTTTFGPPPKHGVVTIPLKKFAPSDITLGYAATTHKSQGCTVDHAYVLTGGRLTNQEMLYVQATRARKATHFFLDKAHAGPDFEDIIAAAGKSAAKDLAHDRAPRSRRGPELEREQEP